MFTAEEKRLVKSSWGQVEPIADQAAALFYGRLFEIAPDVKPLFKGDITAQGAKLMKTLTFAVNSLDNLEGLVPILQNLARKHVDYGVKPEYYEPVGAALIWTLEQGLGDAFTPATRDAWLKVYGVVSSTMIEAASSEVEGSALGERGLAARRIEARPG